MKKRFIIQAVVLFAAILIPSLTPIWTATPPGHESDTPFDSVNPFIGTREMGHTYPGATVPFGMVQLSPDTGYVPFFEDGAYNKKVYRYCAGYQYDDPTIIGFSHTHFNGTGHSDLGDFLVMPTVGELQLEPGSEEKPETGFRSRFSHQTEAAQPGYYRVRLDDYGIDAQLTATTRVGFHHYTFPKTDDAHIILDLIYSIYGYDGKVTWSSVRVENDRLITGHRQTNGWARDRRLYFAMEFSKPFKSYGYMNKETFKYNGFRDRALKPGDNFPHMEGRALRAYFNFSTLDGQPIMVKFAVSPVGTEGALKNLRAEVPHWDFDKTRAQAKGMWEAELNRVRIEASKEVKEIFYTAMYHTFLGPVTYMDVDGQYRGLDGNIHKAEGFDHYTLFSLWDTYRALHPWLTIHDPKRVNHMIRSMLLHWEQSIHKLLPVWSFHGNEAWCMTGYHSVPVIADAYMKGIRDYDVEKAFTAMVTSARHKEYSGLGNYMTYGYVPFDLEMGQNSASKTLEYAYDDWTIAVMAEAMGKKTEAAEFMRRAGFYRNLFDAKTKFIRAKNSKGEWLEPFDPMDTHGQGYIEGNAWNYSLHIPQDVRGYIDLTGGDKPFAKRLDHLFNMTIPGEAIAQTEDIERSGIMGGYIHGNEPGHHIPYLYNYAGQPWKTQEVVHRIVNTMYSTRPDGIPGNDDTGQMSAWYLFSALGFYPVCPGSNEYVLAGPSVDRAEIELTNGKRFTVIAGNLSPKNVYIGSVTLNGKVLKKSVIMHEDILMGGTLEFVMSPVPNKKWAVGMKFAPYSMTR